MSVVALESTVFVHGLPYPVGMETAFELERIVKESGARPRTVGIVGGEPVVGLSGSQIRRLATADHVRKASLRDLPVAVASGRDAATTVASTCMLAHNAGIGVVCTGGIGGAHRDAPNDVSNDLATLAVTPVTLVCSGAKAILDLDATRERLETFGITVIGYQTDEFPGFYSRSTGLRVDTRCDTPEDVAAVVNARNRLGLTAATLVCVPVPEKAEIPADELNAVIESVCVEAEHEGIRGAALTPFLLERVAVLTDGQSLAANVALLKRNAAVAARISLAVA